MQVENTLAMMLVIILTSSLGYNKQFQNVSFSSWHQPVNPTPTFQIWSVHAVVLVWKLAQLAA